MIKKIIFFILFISIILIWFNYQLSKNINSYINIKAKTYTVDKKYFDVSIKENNDVTEEFVQKNEPVSVEFIKNKNQSYNLNIKNYKIDSNVCHEISNNIENNIYLLENNNSYILFLFNDNKLNFNSIRTGFFDLKIRGCKFDLQIKINNIFKTNKKLYLFDKYTVLEEFEIK